MSHIQDDAIEALAVAVRLTGLDLSGCLSLSDAGAPQCVGGQRHRSAAAVRRCMLFGTRAPGSSRVASERRPIHLRWLKSLFIFLESHR